MIILFTAMKMNGLVLRKNLTISNNVKQKKRVTKECIPYGIKFQNRQN